MKDFIKIFHHSNQSMKDYYHHCSALKLRELNTYLTNNIEYIVVWCKKQTKAEKSAGFFLFEQHIEILCINWFVLRGGRGALGTGLGVEWLQQFNSFTLSPGMTWSRNYLSQPSAHCVLLL